MNSMHFIIYRQPVHLAIDPLPRDLLSIKTSYKLYKSSKVQRMIFFCALTKFVGPNRIHSLKKMGDNG